jgi:nucleotide-binding universal stress UspA family protein
MTHHTPDLRILFPTSFSDPCFRTARAIAQLADTARIGVTITHVVPPGGATRAKHRELDSFWAEADHYDSCQRVLIEAEDASKAIAELCDKGCYDLVVAPKSDRFGLHRMVTSSFRARLMKECCAPVWTAGGCLDSADFKGSVRTIACLIDFDQDSDSYLPLAVGFAARIGAKVRVLHVIPPVDEATLMHSLHSRAPLMPEVARERIREAFAGSDCPEVDVAVGDVSAELPKMLRRGEADLAFVGPGHALCGTWVPRLSRYLDRLPCPVICVDGASAKFERWTFQDALMAEAAVAAERREVVRARDWAIAS